MLIALIDDGIDTTKYKGLRVKHDLQIGRDCVVRERPAEHKIITDHGTTCAGIILKYSPWAEFCSIRVFHQGRLRTTSDQIVAAMEWCLEQRIPIIHLSLGSSQQNDFSKLRSVTAKLLQRNLKPIIFKNI